MITFQKVSNKVKEEGLLKTAYKGLRIFFSLIPPISFFSYLYYKLLKKQAVKEINGSKMLLDVNVDSGLSKDLFLHKKREVCGTDYMLNSGILQEGDIVLDIGANIGYYVLIESKIVGDTGKVYALEPVTHSFKVLSRNVELNNIKNVEVYNMAAGSDNRKDFINVSTHMNRSSMINHRGATFIRKEEIEVVKGDDFLKGKRSPKLIRMDVGGYEPWVIEGLKETLNSATCLFMEVHPSLMKEADLRGMFQTFKDKNFSKAVLMFDPHLSYLNSEWQVKTPIKWLTKKIGDEEKLGVTKSMDLTSLLNFLILNKDSTHVFISK